MGEKALLGYKNCQKGYSLVEILIALLIVSVVTIAAYRAYLTTHKVENVQAAISDTQQNARASLNLLTDLLKVAGSFLPAGLSGIQAANTNPDTITIRFSSQSGTHTVSNTIAAGAKDVFKIPLSDNLSGWGVGTKFYFWKVPNGPGQWLTVAAITKNAADGVYEIAFSEAAVTGGCSAGDAIVKLTEFKYYVDQTDSLNPVFMQRDGLGSTGVLAEGLRNLNFTYTLANGAVVDVPTAADTIKLVNIDLTAATEKADPDWQPDGGHHLRRLTTSVYILSN